MYENNADNTTTESSSKKGKIGIFSRAFLGVKALFSKKTYAECCAEWLTKHNR